jgi:hypothetical protein
MPNRTDLHGKKRYWFCQPCDAWTACAIDDDRRPIGFMANKELRQLREDANSLLRVIGMRSGYAGANEVRLWDRIRRACQMPGKGKFNLYQVDAEILRKAIQFLKGIE